MNMMKINGLLGIALVSASTMAFAHEDIVANADGYYDVTLTTKRLAHSEKTVTKTFTTSERKGLAVDQFKAEYATVSQYAGFQVIDVNGKVDFNLEELEVKTIKFKYSYFDFKLVYSGTGKSKVLIGTNYVTKIVSDSNKGVYDANDGKVYLWNTLAASKVSVTNGTPNSIVLSKTDRKGVEKQQSGFVAYEVPLAMHKQFVATDDNKAAGGFFGASAKSEDGTKLDFSGFTAFGSGTFDSKNDVLKSVAGNVAMKDPSDIKYGAYGTWKIQLDTSAKTKAAENIKDVLRNKGCVELFMERN